MSEELSTAAEPFRLATYLFGGASIAAGVFDVVWGEFEAAHQPIGALGDHVPGQLFLAYLSAALLIFGGAGVMWRLNARAGAVALGIVYLEFALFWVPRFYSAPHALGFRLPVMSGLIGGVFMQLILVAAAGMIWRRAGSLGVRWIFGLAAISFGVVHLTGVEAAARMIPGWMPLTAGFWVVLTGVAFVMAGVAILARVLDVLAARMLALMLLLFDVLVLVRLPVAAPHNHVAWGANAYNLAAVGAVWMFAEFIRLHGLRAGSETAGAPGESQGVEI